MVLSKRPIKRANRAPKRTVAKSRTGLSFNGVTDYLQLPSVTMDSVEIECLIDSVQPTDGVFFQRTSPVSLFARVSGQLVNVTTNSFTGNTPRNTRFKGKFSFDVGASTTFIFANASGGYPTKGILYKVTCYLNGSIVAQYDFENPRSLVGTSVLQSAVNLIPSFEDSRWSLHANAKVLGKDVLHLDATANYNESFFDFPNPIIGSTYRLIFGGLPVNGYEIVLRAIDSNGSQITQQFADSTGNTLNLVVPSGTSKLRIVFSNWSKGIGSFDFIRPQLYALDGKEGTLYGAPVQQLKHAKRRLYAKR